MSKKKNFKTNKMKKITMVLCLTLAICSQSFSQQFYLGNSITANGIQLNGGYIENDLFAESSLSFKPNSDGKKLNQLSLMVGKQFIFFDEGEDREVFIKIAPSFGVAQNNFIETIKTGNYNEKWKMEFPYDTYKNSSTINMIYKLELALHREPFEYFINVGYSKTAFVGIGWRGLFEKIIR